MKVENFRNLRVVVTGFGLPSDATLLFPQIFLH